jgi:hypothetical protein
MPPVKGKSSLFDKLKKEGLNTKVHQESAEKDTTLSSGGDVPAGVTGVAQLIKCVIDEYGKDTKNPGKPYLHLRSVVISPKEHNGTPIDGLQISKRIDLFTKTGANGKSFAEQWDKAMAQLRTLGLETKGTSEEELINNLLPALEQSGVVHRFNSWGGDVATEGPYKGKPGIINYNFGKPVSSEAVTGDTHEVEDATGADENQDDAQTEDWGKLGELADSGDIESQNKITAAGEKYGVDTVGAADWAAAATAIAEAEQGGAAADAAAEAGGGEAAEPWKPEVGHVYMYQIKGARAPEPHEVTAVFAKTLNLKREKDQRIEKAVPWSANPDMLGGKPLINQ